MESTSRVSAVITTHGRLELLKKAIESVKKQTYPNIELFVIDDCSEDGTRQWAQGQTGFVYSYIPKAESKGGNYARNRGIALSHGKYVAFLDDDDTWEPEKIQKQVALIESNEKLGFVYCGSNICFPDGRVIPGPAPTCRGDVSKKALTTIFALTSTLLVRRDLLDQAGGFDEDLGFWQETELIMRLAQICETDFVPEPLLNLLQAPAKADPERLTTKLDAWLKAVQYIEQKHQALLAGLSPEEKKERQLLIYRDAANRCLLSGQRKKRRYYKKQIFLLKPNLRTFVAYVFGIDRLWLQMRGY